MANWNLRLLAGLGLVALFASSVLAQPVLTGSNESVLPGDVVTASALLDNPDPVRGFSFGLAHDGSLLTLDDIRQGAAVASANGGTGADFFFTDITPVGGTGGTVGCVLSLSAPLDEIPPGSGHEIVLFDYTAAGAAAPAAVSSLDFVDTLGSPPVEIIISVMGITQIPNLVSGSVTILTPAVSGLGCTLTDVCECVFDLGWTNPIAYDSIQIVQDGNVVQTLAGTATSTTLDVGGFGTYTLGVVGISNGQAATEIQCVADCPVIPPPTSPDQILCIVDSTICEATITWNNTSAYTSIEVSLDGNVVQTISGGSTSAVVTLPGIGFFDICLDGVDMCGVAFPQACCNVECLQPYVRGDINEDGFFNISDAIRGLGVLFNGKPTACDLALDLDDDDILGLPDPLFILAALFQGGPLPSAPFPACGFDPTPGVLRCDAFAVCP